MKLNLQKKNVPIAILAFYSLLIICHHIFGYIGHYCSGDLTFAHLAAGIGSGSTDFNNHDVFRWPLIILTTIFYKIFGVNDFSSSLPSILVAITILIVIYQIVKEQNNIVLFIALGIATLSQWNLFYSDKIWPDVYVSLFVILTIYILFKVKYTNKATKNLKQSIIFAMVIIGGLISNASYAVVFPLLIYIAILDIRLKRDIVFWKNTIYAFFGGLVVYFLLILLITGSASVFFRYAIDNSYLNSCAYVNQPALAILKRLAFQVFEMMIYQGMLLGIIFVVAGIIRRDFKDIWLINDPFSFLLASSVVLLFSADLMTLSITGYNILCPDPKNFLFIVPVAAIPASIIINDFFNEKKYAIQIIIALAVITGLSFLMPGQMKWELYVPMLVLFVSIYFIPKDKVNIQVYVAVFFAILMVKPALMIKYAGTVGYHKQKEVAFKQLIDKKEPCYIITDKSQKNLGEYFTGFKNDHPCKFLVYSSFSFDTLKSDRKKYLFYNWYTAYLSGVGDNELPLYAKLDDPKNVLIHRDDKLNISVVELNRVPELSPLFQSLNDFENPKEFWNTNEKNVVFSPRYNDRQ